MANINQPFGFAAVRPLFGGIERANRYTIAGGYGTSIFCNQPVVLTGTGRDIAAAAGSSEQPLGIFIGCEYIPAAGDDHPRWSKFWPASTAVQAGTTVDAFVLDDPDEEFVVQADGSLAATDVGVNADFNPGTGSAITGFAASTLKVAGKGTGGTLLLNITGLADAEGNDWGAYAKVRVRFNIHRYRSTTGV